MMTDNVVDLNEGGGLAMDFTQVQDLGLINPGTYPAIVTEAKSGTSEAGYPKVDLQWQIQEGEFANRIVFDTLSFAPKALPFTKAKLIGMGYPENFSGEIYPEDMLSCEAYIRVKVQKSTITDPATGEPYEDRNSVSKVTNGELLENTL